MLQRKTILLALEYFNDPIVHSNDYLNELKENYVVKVLSSKDILDLAYIESQENFDFLILINFTEIDITYSELVNSIKKSIETLEMIEHFAIVQPMLIYGRISDSIINLEKQRKSITSIVNLDSRFLAIKGSVLKNFSILSEDKKSRISWRDYISKINLYGYEAIRLNSICLKAARPSKFSLERILDGSDLVNLFLLRESYQLAIDLSNLDPIFNGTSEYAINLVKEIVPILKENGIRFQIIVEPETVLKFDLIDIGEFCISSKESDQKFYELIFIPQQIFSFDILERIHRKSFKFSYTMLDIIALRSRDLGSNRGFEIVSSIGYKYAESILGLTESSSLDTELFFRERMIFRKVETVYLSKNPIEFKELDFDDVGQKEGEDFILIIGNSFKHKAIEKALDNLLTSKFKIVVIADKFIASKYRGKFSFLSSGSLSSIQIERLYQTASLILYPSLYEGFGLPVLSALQYGKCILVYNSDVNRELKIKFDKLDLIYFFSVFRDLENSIALILSENRNLAERNSINRSWSEIAKETYQILEKDIEREVDFDKLNDRIYEINMLKDIRQNAPIRLLENLYALFKFSKRILIRKIHFTLNRIRFSL